MYQYNEVDHQIVQERVAQFRDQVARRLRGDITEAQFRPLRLMNGLYLQRHAYMLRVAIPYGLLSVAQLRMLAHIARRYDRGYGHFTTRQNIQYNWPKLAEVPDLLADLASVEMHAIQTSGNCIRNVTSDPYAGVAADETVDPRPTCELIRQWSTFHPEFSYLPRKFKIAVTGASKDRAAIAVHDIGLRVRTDAQGELRYDVYVGGGLGRTPMVGVLIREDLPAEHLLSYLEAILRVYNLDGDRENKFRARIKVLVKTLGPAEFTRRVEETWQGLRDGALKVRREELERLARFFTPFPYDSSNAPARDLPSPADEGEASAFARWRQHNTRDHKVAGYRIVVVSLKHPDQAPGDATAEQMELVADLAETYSFGQVRVTHEQNIVLADVPEADLLHLWRHLRDAQLATPNIGTLTDMICCPGLDYCSLANAGSIAVARQIQDHFEDMDYLYDLGELQLKMSGCINACGHHHVGHIGILGINKAGEEFYQIMVGGSPSDDASLGKFLGPAVAQSEVAPAIDRMLQRYLTEREEGERFLDTVRRVGIQPFKESVYAHH